MAMPNGLRAREYAKFRETRHGRTAVGQTNEDEATPATVLATDSGDTEILPAAGAGENYVIKGFHISNAGSSKITVALKTDTDAPKQFTTCLPADGGSIDKNLIGRYWRLPLNAPLYINLSADGEVYVTIEYEGGEEPGPEGIAVTDSQSIAESVAKAVTKPALTDSQTITEALAKDAGKVQADSMGVAESLLITGDRSKALEDTLSIAESLANGITLSLSDSQSISEDMTIQYNPA